MRRIGILGVVFALLLGAALAPATAATFVPSSNCTATPNAVMSSAKYNACIAEIAAAINASFNALPSSTKAALPAASTPGLLYRVTDDVRGIWMDTGTQWVLVGGVLNVKDFGATGDGTTDDTAAIQAALDAAVAGTTKILYFPPGTYLKTGAAFDLDGVADLHIFGAGPASILYNPNNDNPVFWVHNASRVLIADLQFKANYETVSGATLSSGKALWTDNTGTETTTDLVVERCLFTQMTGDAIRVGPGTVRGIIRNNVMVGGLGFVEFTGTVANPTYDLQIVGNHITASLSATSTPRAAGITGSDDLIDSYGGAFNVLIAGNTFDGKTTSASATTFRAGVLLIPDTDHGIIRNITIANNTFRRFTTDRSYASYRGAINVWLGSDPDGAQDIHIIGNTIEDADIGVYVTGGASNEGIAITGNRISNTLVPISYTADNGHIVGNQTYDSTWGIYHSGTAAVVTGNFIQMPATATGSGIQAGHKDLVVGNKIIGGAATAEGIHVVGDDTVVTGNFIQDTLGSGITVHASSDRTILRNNRCLNCATILTDSSTSATTSKGGGTIDAAHGTTSTVVAESSITASSVVVVTPANAIAAGLTGVYVDTLVAGTSFTLHFSDPGGSNHGTFNYQVIN